MKGDSFGYELKQKLLHVDSVLRNKTSESSVFQDPRFGNYSFICNWNTSNIMVRGGGGGVCIFSGF
jgi:hypothetical protein